MLKVDINETKYYKQIYYYYSMNGVDWIVPAGVSSSFLTAKAISDDYVSQYISNKDINLLNSLIPLVFILLYKLITLSSIPFTVSLFGYAIVHNLSIVTIEKSKQLVSHEPNAMIIQSLNIVPTTIYCYYTSPEFDMRIIMGVILTNGVVYMMWYYDNQYTQISSEEENLSESFIDNTKRRDYLILAILSAGLFSCKDIMLKGQISNGTRFQDVMFMFYLVNMCFSLIYCRLDNSSLMISFADNYEKISNNMKAVVFYMLSQLSWYIASYNYLAAIQSTNNIVYPRVLENNRLFIEIPLSYIVHEKSIHPVQMIGGGCNALSLFLVLYFGRS